MGHFTHLLAKMMLGRQCLQPAILSTSQHSSWINQSGCSTIRCCTSLSQGNVQKQPINISEQNYTIFYRFPFIRIARVISRMKIYQTGFTMVAIPSIAVAQSFGHLQDSSVPMATGVAFFAGGMLCVMSHYFRRLIGIMGINNSSNTVRVSHLTFWGKRHDLFVPVDQIVPISELPDHPSEAYVKLHLYDSEDYFYYSIRYGQIVDKVTFKRVMGRLA